MKKIIERTIIRAKYFSREIFKALYWLAGIYYLYQDLFLEDPRFAVVMSFVALNEVYSSLQDKKAQHTRKDLDSVIFVNDDLMRREDKIRKRLNDYEYRINSAHHKSKLLNEKFDRFTRG